MFSRLYCRRIQQIYIKRSILHKNSSLIALQLQNNTTIPTFYLPGIVNTLVVLLYTFVSVNNTTDLVTAL